MGKTRTHMGTMALRAAVLLAALTALLLLLPRVQAQTLTQDCTALGTFFEQNGGIPWFGTCCGLWVFGAVQITCANVAGATRVTGVAVLTGGLTQSLASLSGLDRLQQIYLPGCRFTGQFPDLSNTALTSITLTGSFLSGNVDGLLPQTVTTCALTLQNSNSGLFGCTGNFPATCAIPIGGALCPLPPPPPPVPVPASAPLPSPTLASSRAPTSSTPRSSSSFASSKPTPMSSAPAAPSPPTLTTRSTTQPTQAPSPPPNPTTTAFLIQNTGMPGQAANNANMDLPGANGPKGGGAGGDGGGGGHLNVVNIAAVLALVISLLILVVVCGTLLWRRKGKHLSGSGGTPWYRGKGGPSVTSHLPTTTTPEPTSQKSVFSAELSGPGSLHLQDYQRFGDSHILRLLFAGSKRIRSGLVGGGGGFEVFTGSGGLGSKFSSILGTGSRSGSALGGGSGSDGARSQISWRPPGWNGMRRGSARPPEASSWEHEPYGTGSHVSAKSLKPHWAFMQLLGGTDYVEDAFVDFPEVPLLVVESGFTPQAADELSLHTGDQVRVHRMFRDGWVLGVNIRTEESGMFPVDHLCAGYRPSSLPSTVPRVESASLRSASKKSGRSGSTSGPSALLSPSDADRPFPPTNFDFRSLFTRVDSSQLGSPRASPNPPMTQVPHPALLTEPIRAASPREFSMRHHGPDHTAAPVASTWIPSAAAALVPWRTEDEVPPGVGPVGSYLR
ncbi:hypothetical protein M427DRAFT_68872 [Gonapodya prolifera JEL478]|uniref:SH3 domain-containing protein n=1 Tax=Gonapodya prolifera (strain JEL478) TaxID=1344416 RepID=A0A139AJH1_GONPJ|nr:hypothetical protein M427DRAFT_68872 [Gonapodya prolifera JEL478]|eukprot:KXS16858.1 hypothetical protein M427DRAFT_68872 [Gonapodya prolifera JEL478]